MRRGRGSCVTVCELTGDADSDGFRSVDCGGTDCNDSDGTIFPGAFELCDDVDDDCDPTTTGALDRDGDGNLDDRCSNVDGGGTETRGDDCDDFRADVSPDSVELCDHIDNDCDTNVDEGVTEPRYPDLDGDGEGDATAGSSPGCPDDARTSAEATDCDDADLTVRAGQVEICDGVDNDCDMMVDENPRAVAWYPDEDRDLYGDVDATDIVVSCAPVVGRSLLAADCDDTAVGVSPIGMEVCDGVDNDCNGLLDADDGHGGLEDDDGDGIPDARCMAGERDVFDLDFGAAASPSSAATGSTTTAMARSTRVRSRSTGSPTATETASGPAPRCFRIAHSRRGWRSATGTATTRARARVPSCLTCATGSTTTGDGVVDENTIRRATFVDTDDDGFGVEPGFQMSCGASLPGRADLPRDCAPDDPLISVRYADGDGDGVGTGEPLESCAVGTTSDNADDCDDADPLVTTECRDELCDGIDNDADEMIDEGAEAFCPGETTTTNFSCTAGACEVASCIGLNGDCNGSAPTGVRPTR